MIPISDSHPAGRFPLWTIGIIILNVYVFFLELTALSTDAFILQYGLVPSLINLTDYNSLTPFITSQFLHGGFLHIISNMLFLWVFGDNVEARFGYLLFPIFYLAGGVFAGLSQYLLNPTSTIPMIGASGAVAGVLGAYLALFPHHTIKTLIPVFGFFTLINIPATFMLIYWFITQLFSGTLSIAPTATDQGGVAYFAHIGGFAFGFIIAKLFPNSQALRPID